MKKRNLKNLSLNKNSISNLEHDKLFGGDENPTNVYECPSILVKPHCFSRPTDYSFCNCPSAVC